MSQLVSFCSNPQGFNCVTSLQVSELFGLEHKNVLRKIANLVKEEELGRLNFEPTSYMDSWNREQQMYLLTSEGFSILALLLNLRSKEAKAVRKQVMIKFQESQQRLISRNLKLEKAENQRNEGKGKYGYALFDTGGEFLKKCKVLKKDHTESELRDGMIQHLEDIIFGVRAKITVLTLEAKA